MTCAIYAGLIMVVTIAIIVSGYCYHTNDDFLEQQDDYDMINDDF